METLNPFFEWLLKTSLQASLLIGLILLLQILLRSRLPVRWRYSLWLVLLIRLALPWAPQSSVSLFNLLPRDIGSLVAPFSAEPSANVDADRESVRGDFTLSDIFGSTEDAAVINDSKSIPVSDKHTIPQELPESFISAHLQWTQLLPLVWFAGAAVLVVYVAATNFHLWRIVKVKRPLTEKKILDLLEDCKAQMGVQTILGIVQTDSIKSPALFGFIRPRLLLPEGLIDSVNPAELRYIFLHELGHLKRYDILQGWLMAALQVLHWFNPLIWLAFHRVRADRELVCDALAMGTMKSDEPPQYGRTIVNLLERFSRTQYLPSMAGILENKAHLKRRITMIAKFQKSTKKATVAAVILTLALGCLVLTNAQASSDTKKEIRQEEIKKIIEQSVLTISTCTDTDPRIGTSLESLKGLEDKAVVKELAKFLDSDKKTIRRSALYILWKGNFKSIEPAVSVLQKLCSHKERHTRGMAAIALGANKINLSYDTLSNMTLNDSSAYARRCAAYALGLMGQSKAKPILEKALKDSDFNVRNNAEAALTMLSQVTQVSRKVPERNFEVTSHIDSRGHKVDKIDYSFVNDPDVIGVWKSVDFIGNIGDFNPDVKQWKGGELYLRELVIQPNGRTAKPWWTWTKSLILHSGDKTASRYIIKELNGSTYMFFEWKSGDYTILHRKPKYYVLKREKGIVRTRPTRPTRAKPRTRPSQPRVISTEPVAFANDVSPSLKKITVTFDREMMDGSWSWTGGGDTYPKSTGKIFYDRGKKTCTMPVKLEPGRVYWVGINSPSHKNFKTPKRVPARRYVILFATTGKNGKPTPIPEKYIASARRINPRTPVPAATVKKSLLEDLQIELNIYIVAFRAASQFDPRTPKELLDAFNKNHPKGVRTHHFRTTIEGGELVGLICVDGGLGLKDVVTMLRRNDRLVFINSTEATPEKLRILYNVNESPGRTERVKKVTDAERKSAELLSSKAWKLLGDRKMSRAEEMFQKAVDKDPTNSNAWNGLGWSQINQDMPLNAKEAFEKCLEIEPEHAAALNGLGWIAKGQGKTDEAISHWEKAVKALPTGTAALDGLAQTFMKLKQYDKSVKYYQMWLKVEPNNEQARDGLKKAKAGLEK
ncbi:MAG: tetratricopeptide repeat protein [Sedimentisphaerales bacterium]|nr:tetratricopeptide repeat protein [Sedimentisphaerales bacterium]